VIYHKIVFKSQYPHVRDKQSREDVFDGDKTMKQKTTKRKRIDRRQAKKRMEKKRDANLIEGGENLSGTIDKSTARDLGRLVSHLQKTDSKASKIGATRFAIKYVANILREEGKLI